MAQRVPATPVIFLYVKDHDKKIWSWKFYCARTITFQYIWRKPEFTPERLLNQAVLARDQPWRHGVNVAILVKRKQCDFSPLWTIISRWKRPIMDFKVCVHWNVTIFWYFVTFPLIWTLFLPTIVPWTMAEDTPTTQSRGVKRCVAWGCNKTYKNSEVSLSLWSSGDFASMDKFCENIAKELEWTFQILCFVFRSLWCRCIPGKISDNGDCGTDCSCQNT